jgi:hypothetical protein
MPNRSPAGPPMTLGNMRENGVCRLKVSCWLCHHSGVLDVDGFADDVPVPAAARDAGRFRLAASVNWSRRPNALDRLRLASASASAANAACLASSRSCSWHAAARQTAIRYLNVTSSGRQWIANLYSNVFRAERVVGLSGPQL